MTGSSTLASRCILVVEDQYLLAADVCEWLQDAGAKVVGPVPDSERARKLIDSDNLDAAVVDINLGRGPLFDVARELARRQVPFLFATGYDVGAIPSEFKQVPRLEKPFTGDRLVAAVREVIEHAKPLMTSRRLEGAP